MNAYVFLRTNYVKKDGSCGIYLRILIGQKKKDYNLQISIKPELWNTDDLRVKNKHPLAKKYNLIIENEIKKANDILIDSKIGGNDLSFSQFEFLYKKVKNNKSCLDFIIGFIDENRHTYTDETIRSYNSYLTKLKKYKTDLSFDEVNSIEFSKDYSRFMMNRMGNEQNTVRKSLSFIKTVLNSAQEKNLIQEVKFNFKLKKLPGNREYLTENELKSVEVLLQDRRLRVYQLRVLEYFLFSCYTGLRYKDVKTLKYKHFIKKDVQDRVKMKSIQKDFLKKKINKTKRSTGFIVEIPLLKKAAAITGQGLPDEYVFPVAANSNVNLYLKEIMDLAGVQKKISYHCARHTFAVHCATLGIPIEVVQKILGHSDIRTTQIYYKIVDSAKVEAMNKWED